MYETITVDEAIAKGHRMVNYPVVGIIVGTIGITCYLGIQAMLPWWVFPLGFILAFVLGWLYWSIMITKWRLWAFENVRNVHELKKRAIREKLIWPDGSFYEKTEIRGAQDKERWTGLQYKFAQDDVFHDDPSVPHETIIYYAKGKNFIEMAFMLLLMVGGIFLEVRTDTYIIGSLMAVVGAFLSYRKFREATNTTPQIILNEQGIQTIDTPFYKWSEITDEEAISEGTGNNIRYYLIYQYSGGHEKLSIDDYDINPKSLNKLLILYRGRSQKQKVWH
ncbi:hypothetical protein QNI19_36115 [Cytophagaceae bacterium DM2B3-1]|uniref:Uncharacterized protein n=1 Tax=Xanthocytophaga flava TaxID=3048013 RepID=A0ABT7CXE7_9BACT|nr:hypothetical protein [Xanthocytophaga flavus]MDJ1498417.1 hypothetical protein [Xanthocytophaga flavus]